MYFYIIYIYLQYAKKTPPHFCYNHTKFKTTLELEVCGLLEGCGGFWIALDPNEFNGPPSHDHHICTCRCIHACMLILCRFRREVCIDMCLYGGFSI